MAAGLIAAALPAVAQSARPWIDPPSETTGSVPSSGPSRESHEVKSAPPHALAPAQTTGASKKIEDTKKIEETTKEEPQPSTEPTVAAKQPEPTGKSLPQKTVRESKVRKAPRSVTTARGERQRPMIQQRDVAEQVPRDLRGDRIRQGLNSGLEVMTLRTIEFPDGRRIQILTKPGANSLSELYGPEQ